MRKSAVLLVECPDQKGLDAAIAEFIFRHDGNILHFEQHQAGEERFYLARVEWDLTDFTLPMQEFAAKYYKFLSENKKLNKATDEERLKKILDAHPGKKKKKKDKASSNI